MSPMFLEPVTLATNFKTSERQDKAQSCIVVMRYSLADVLVVSPRPRLSRSQFASTVERLKKLEYNKAGREVSYEVVGIEVIIHGVSGLAPLRSTLYTWLLTAYVLRLITSPGERSVYWTRI